MREEDNEDEERDLPCLQPSSWPHFQCSGKSSQVLSSTGNFSRCCFVNL